MGSHWRTLIEFIWPYPAVSVSLKTSLDDWKRELPLTRSSDDGLFHLSGLASEGVFEYKYIVDEEWRHDPSCPTNTDSSQNVNNYRVVARGNERTAPATFTWSESATSVTVFGSWDDWRVGIDLEKGEAGGFFGAGRQPPGVYQFKFLVDGIWRVNPYLPTVVDDEGNVNNVVDVPSQLPNFQPQAYEEHIEFDHWDPSSEFMLTFDFQMSLSGSWDKWTSSLTFGRNEDGDFQCIAFVPPGIHQFKLFNGLDWFIHPDFPTAMDENGNVNNVVVVLPFHREYS